MGYTCGLCKPRYLRHVDDVYPRDPKDEKLIRSDMDKLLCYTLSHPEKLDRIGQYLYEKLADSIYRMQQGWVKVSIDAIVELLKANHDQRINLFISSYLKMVQLLLESTTHDFRRYGTVAFDNFSKVEEEAAAYDRNYDQFIRIFCKFCYDSSKNVQERQEMRVCGIQGIQGVLRKMMKSQSTDQLLKQHSKLIIPSLLFNMQEDDAEDVVSGSQPTQDSPRYLSEEVIGELLSCITLSQVELVIAPLLLHCDKHKLWERENAITWAKLFMKSVRERFRQNIIKLILEHTEREEFQHEKATLIKRGILNVVSEIAPIPDKNMMGSIAPELVAIVTRGMDVREMMDDPDLLDQYVRTCGDIISHLDAYIQKELLQNMIDGLVEVRFLSPLLLAISHCFASFAADPKNDPYVVASVIPSLLQVAKTKLGDFSADDRVIVGRILVTAVDMNKNVSHLARSGSWSDASGFNVAKANQHNLSTRQQANNITMWIYDNMKKEDNSTQNYILYYQLVGVLLIEFGGEVVVQLVKIMLAIQDEMSTPDLFEHAFKTQTHSCIASSLRLMSCFYDPLLSAVQLVINERKNGRPQLTPDAMFSGSSDALRRSTASLYSREEPQIDKYLFKRQEVCDALKTAGFDVSSLSDPLGIMVESVSDGMVKAASIERDAESVQITIQDETDHANRTQQSTISFQDIYQAYRSVPQTLDELNERDSRQLEQMQKLEFQQIVSQLEEARRNETEMMKKILNYSTHLVDSGTFSDYEETSFPDLFVY